MSYRTKRPRIRAILTFGVGATLAITQLGAGCVPPGTPSPCAPDASVDEAGNCTSTPPSGSDGGADK